MDNAEQLDGFRNDVRGWVKENFPASLAGVDLAGIAVARAVREPAMKLKPVWKLGANVWRKKVGGPTWPVEFGGGGLSDREADIIGEEIFEAGAYNPIPHMTGMGITMVGPTLLEYGTDEQKERHLKGIASGEVRWCLGRLSQMPVLIWPHCRLRQRTGRLLCAKRSKDLTSVHTFRNGAEPWFALIRTQENATASAS